MSGWSSQVLVATQVVINGTGDFLLVYNGPAAAGNLIASIAASPGTDPFGNPFPAGFNAQQGSLASELFANLINGRLFLGQLKAGGVQDTADAAQVFSNTNPASVGLDSGKDAINVNTGLLLLQAGTNVAGGGPQLFLADGDGAANLIVALTGNLLIEPLETGQVLLFANAQPGQTADLIQFDVNSVTKFDVDKGGDITVVGTINPLVTGHAQDAASSTTTSTTYAASTRALAATAVLPASGKAEVSFLVRSMCSVAGDNVLSDLTITGSTSGTLHAAGDASAIQWNETTSAGPFVTRQVVTGVAGETLTATAQHRVNTATTTGTFLFRDIVINTLPV